MKPYNFKTTADKWAYLKATYDIKVYLEDITITSVKKIAKDNDRLFIPDIVTGIADSAFDNCNGIKELYIPDSVKEIGNYAFCNCENLMQLYIGKNARFSPNIVGFHALGEYKLISIFHLINTSVVATNNKEEIKKLAHVYDEYDNPENDLKESDEGYTIFLLNDACVLVEVPKEKIQDGYFALDKITYQGKELKNIIMGKIGNLKKYCKACDISADVKEISGTFEMSDLKFIILPESLKCLYRYAFGGCHNLEYVRMPRKMDYISGGTFSGCRKLKDIVIPEGIKEIFPNTYSLSDDGCSITIPTSVKMIHGRAFGIEYTNVNIEYLGTVKEWKKIIKDPNWDSFTSENPIINCTDGDVLERMRRNYD